MTKTIDRLSAIKNRKYRKLKKLGVTIGSDSDSDSDDDVSSEVKKQFRSIQRKLDSMSGKKDRITVKHVRETREVPVRQESKREEWERRAAQREEREDWERKRFRETERRRQSEYEFERTRHMFARDPLGRTHSAAAAAAAATADAFPFNPAASFGSAAVSGAAAFAAQQTAQAAAAAASAHKVMAEREAAFSKTYSSSYNQHLAASLGRL